jgi:hypothetical protein
MDKIPCKHDIAVHAIQKLKQAGKHEYCPIPAIDVNQKPIRPQRAEDYKRALMGSVALIRFTVSCDTIGNARQYYADLVSLSVLCTPKPISQKKQTENPFHVPDILQQAMTRQVTQL